jgi:hypothetical protein
MAFAARSNDNRPPSPHDSLDAPEHNLSGLQTVPAVVPVIAEAH